MTKDEFEAVSQKYDMLVHRLVKGAEFLGNPIIKPEVYEAGLRKYDRILEEFMPIRKEFWNHVLGREEI